MQYPYYMANNRMYLKCHLCNEQFYLAKYYPSTGWYINMADGDPQSSKLPTPQEWLTQFIKFMDEHSPCPRRNEAGEYTMKPEGVHMLHGIPDTAQIQLGEVFTLEYE